MYVETIKDDSHEQMSEVVLGLLEIFDSREIQDISPFTPVVMEIMKLPRPQRKSVGIGLVKMFFTEHAINIENRAERSIASQHNPLIVWSIQHAAASAEKAEKRTDFRSGTLLSDESLDAA